MFGNILPMWMFTTPARTRQIWLQLQIHPTWWHKMSFIFIPLCFEFGSDNACRCKVVGPTIGMGSGPPSYQSSSTWLWFMRSRTSWLSEKLFFPLQGHSFAYDLRFFGSSCWSACEQLFADMQDSSGRLSLQLFAILQVTFYFTVILFHNSPPVLLWSPCAKLCLLMPTGALTYCCDRKLSYELFGAPVEVSRDITNACPI